MALSIISSSQAFDKSRRPVGHSLRNITFIERELRVLDAEIGVLFHELKRRLAETVPHLG